MGGEHDALITDFATRDVWERNRDCLFDTRRVHAGIVLVVLLAASLIAASSTARRD